MLNLFRLGVAVGEFSWKDCSNANLKPTTNSFLDCRTFNLETVPKDIFDAPFPEM